MRADVPTTTAHTLRRLRRLSCEMLERAGIERAEREVVWLLESALGYSHLAMLLQGEDILTPAQWERALAFVGRRAAREPVQYLLGTEEFCGRDFTVSPAVLIPRRETEAVVEAVLEPCGAGGHMLVADVGTGSGCIGISLALALPDAVVHATDVSAAALAVARANAVRHGVHERMRFLLGDLVAPLHDAGLEGRLNVLVANPPYIPESALAALQPEVRDFEPWLALSGGADGIALHRALIAAAPRLLAPCGVFALEVGFGQAPAVQSLAEASGAFWRVWTQRDHLGIERVVCGQCPDPAPC